MKKINTPQCRACNISPAEFRCIYCAECLKKLASKEIESVLKDIPPLFDHQKKIIAEDKKKCLLALGTGACKTRTTLHLARGKVLVICPKQQRDDQMWLGENKKWQTNLDITVISKEDLRRDWDSLPPYDTVIIDECENNLGVSPDTYQKKGIQYPKTSQIFDATLSYLRKYPPQRFYALSATPIPKPMALWGLATLMGQKWDFFAFRQKYYTEIRIGGRRIWLAKKDAITKQTLADIVKRFGYTGGLADYFDVPEQTFITVPIELSPAQKKAIDEIVATEADPLVRRAKSRTIENGILYGKEIERVDEKTEKLVKKTKVFESYKIDYILNRALEFPKLLIFANYSAQIVEIEKALKAEGYTVSTLTGATKDRTFLKRVDESPEPHIVIAQSSISSGWELKSFPCVVFASKSWQYRHYEQGLGRVQRADKIKKNLYIHLVVKGLADEGCHEAIMSGQDFQERIMSQIDSSLTKE